MKSCFTTYKQGHSFCHPWIFNTAFIITACSQHRIVGWLCMTYAINYVFYAWLIQ